MIYFKEREIYVDIFRKVIKFEKVQQQQANEVDKLRATAEDFVRLKLLNVEEIVGILLTGSVARGDARIGPFGIFIDLTIVIEKGKKINLSKVAGNNISPNTPFHRIKTDEKIGFQILIVEYDDLINVDDMYESLKNAYFESEVLYEKDNKLTEWKEKSFIITQEMVKGRALENFHQFRYLTGGYRIEKWKNRLSWIQLNQNYNKAAEYYCNFLYCINKQFIPRIDWLSYSTFSLDLKPENHEEVMDKMYTATNNEKSVDERKEGFSIADEWMERYCCNQGWI